MATRASDVVSTKPNYYSIAFSVVGVLAAFVGTTAWVPLGLIIAVAMLTIATKSQKMDSWVVTTSAVLVAVMVVMTGGYVLGLTVSVSSGGSGGVSIPPIPHHI